MKKICLFLSLLLFGATVGRSQSPAMDLFIEQLERLDGELTAAMAAGDRPAMETVYLEVAELYELQSGEVREAAAPIMGGVWYNIACMRSLRGDIKGAADALSKALDFGWNDYVYTMNDPDLARLRADSCFGALADRMK